MNIELIIYRLPVYWACALINGDYTGLSDEDKTAFVLKNGKPVAVLISHERYERLLKAGIDITEY